MVRQEQNLSQNEDIAKMNSRLMSLQAEFAEKTQKFSYQISLHEGRLNQKDFSDFDELINEIR